MKIYIIHVKSEFQPEKCKILYPRHSDYIGVERVFYNWIINQKAILTNNVDEADFCYLPIFWTNYFLNHNFAQTGIEELAEECMRVLNNSEKTFTLCQYDDGPIIDLGLTKIFLGSRKTINGADIPLLCSEHKYKEKSRKKKYLASFSGRLSTHPIRKELAKLIKDREEYRITKGNWGEYVFVNTILKSYACLCPRGYGGGSFRFFEAMQMGVVPIHIGDIDIRPFKKSINWDKCSFYFEHPVDAVTMLDRADRDILVSMGIEAQRVYSEIFASDKWCELLLKEL